MAYARLDIYQPNGEFKTFALADETISIGRSPGSTIVLDTESLSRYHASLIRVDGLTQITDLDSINGTFVDGVRLEPNTPHTIYGGEEIITGDVRMIFHSLDESPTRPIIVLEDSTRRLARAEHPFTVEIDEPEFPIPPGAHVSSTVKIRNTGEISRRFRVEVSGLPDGWARQDRREVEIAPGASGSVVVNFKPRRRSDSTPGDYPVTIGVHPVDDAEMKLSGVIRLHVLAFASFGIALEPSTRRPAAGADSPPGTSRAGSPLRLHLHNGGSAALPIRISARDIEDALRIQIEPAVFNLPPGGRAIAQVIARPRQTRLFGESRAYSFDLVARSGDAAGFIVPVRAAVDERPLLPAWAIFVIGGVGAAAIALLIVTLLLLTQPRAAAPVIARFAVSSGDPMQIAGDAPVMVDWLVSDAETIFILIDDIEAHRDSAGQGSALLDTTSFSGDHTLTLLATGPGGEIRQDVPIRIAPALSIGAFNYRPRPLMLYVTQTLTLDWQVPGATSSVIQGLETFSFSPPTGATPYGESGAISVSGIAMAPVTLILTAERGGAVITQRYDLEMSTPQCTAGADVPLRATPDGASQVVATIPSGTLVVVDAQDTFGRWLRVQLAGGAHGWGERTALTCAGFSPDDLFKAIDALPTSNAAAQSIPPQTAATAAPPPTLAVTAAG